MTTIIFALLMVSVALAGVLAGIRIGAAWARDAADPRNQREDTE